MMNKIKQFNLNGFLPVALSLLILGAAFLPAIINKAAAEDLLVTCTAETPRINGYFITDESGCTIPSNVTVTRVSLEAELDDGGDVLVNGRNVYSVANQPGIDNTTRDLDARDYSAGMDILLRVEARNAIDDNGNALGELHGLAIIKVFGNRNNTQTPTPNNPTPSAACVKPNNLSPNGNVQISGDTGSLNLTWDAVPGAVYYDVRLSDGSSDRYNDPRFNSCDNTNIYYCENRINGTSISNVPVKAGRTYTYWVDPIFNPGRDYCNGGTTFTVTKQVVTTPNTPTPTVNAPSRPVVSAPSCSAGSYTANISWTGTPSPSSEFDYFVDISQDSSFWNNSFYNKKIMNGCTNCNTDTSGFTRYDQQTNTFYTDPMPSLQPNVTYYVRVASGLWGAPAHSPITTLFVPRCDTPNNAPTVDIKAFGSDGPVTIGYQGTADLTWTSTNANTCNLTEFGNVETNGFRRTTNLTSSKTYTITCTGAGGTASDSVTLVVNQQAVTADIKANGSDGPVTINYNNSANLSWTSSGANSCVINEIGSVGTSGSRTTGNLTFSKTYTITCTGNGGTASDSVTLIVNQPSSVSCSPNIQTVNINQSISLSVTGGDGNYTWNAPGGNQTSGSGSSFSTAYSSAGTQVVTVTSGGQTGQCTIIVNQQNQQPTLVFTGNPLSIQQGQSSYLTWTSTNTTNCYASGGWSGGKSLSGSETVYPSQTTTYNMTCTGPGGSVSGQVTIYVNQNNQLPSVNLYVNPSNINSGQGANLSWTSSNANTCFASGGNWSGNKSLSGSETVYPNFTTTYTITCTNQYGTASDTETVYVNYYNGSNNLQITKTVLNRTLNQTYYSNSVEAQGLDVLEFEIRVRNTDNYSSQVTVRDILPAQLYYVPGSTQISQSNYYNNCNNSYNYNCYNNYNNQNYSFQSYSDGIVSGGINLGNLQQNEERVIRFRAVVFAGTQPQYVTNQASASMNSGIQNAYASIQIKNRGQVLGVADIVTGPEDMLPLVLVLGFLGSVGTYLAFFRFRWIKLNTLQTSIGPVTELERMVLEIRDREKGPDTDRLGKK